MKKIRLNVTVMLSMIFILSACTGPEQENEFQVSESETKTQNDQVDPKIETDIFNLRVGFFV